MSVALQSLSRAACRSFLCSCSGRLIVRRLWPSGADTDRLFLGSENVMAVFIRSDSRGLFIKGLSLHRQGRLVLLLRWRPVALQPSDLRPGPGDRPRAGLMKWIGPGGQSLLRQAMKVLSRG